MELTSSSSTWPSVLLLLVITLSLSLLFFLSDRKTKNKGLPPGPPVLLFLARFLVLGRAIFQLGTVLRDLHARYGPVISVRLYGTCLVFVADPKLAHQVLVQGGATFADRPSLSKSVGLFTSGNRDISTSPYGAYWRLVRRNLAAQALQPSSIAQFVAPARRRALDALIRDLLVSSRGGEPVPVTVRPAFRRAMFELLVHMTLGARLCRDAIDEVQELQRRILQSMVSFPIFDVFPALTTRLFRGRWAGFVASRRRQEEIFLPLIQARRRRGERDADHASATADEDPPCYADSLLAVRVADEGGRSLTDAEMVTLCSEFLNGGTDTTVTVLEWIMAELVKHPHIQSKVFDEVKARPQLNVDDLRPMPYLKAVVLEGLRLHTPTHFVIPHGVHRDGAKIGGYEVPKGAEVNFLAADFGRDETTWSAAREFRPERFLDGGEGHGIDLTGSREIKMMPFGAGRRMCPAYTLGMLNLEYFVGSLVKQLEWLPAEDWEEVDMTEKQDFTILMKHPLRARVVPRT